MLKNLKRAAAIVLSFAMAIQFGLANSYYVNAEEEPVEPQQEQTTTVENNSEVQEEDANEVAVPETKSVELSYVAEDGTVLQAATYRDFDLNYGLNTDSSVMLNFDGYTLKDVIVNNSQAVSADQASLSVTSDLVSVQFVYKKIVVETENQTTEPAKTEEKNEDDAEADPNPETEVKEELPEYPAFDQSEMAGNVVVHATAAEGVLPRDSKLVVKRITRKAILNAVEETVSEKNMEVESAVALDITIQNKDGVEIQPNGSVNISFENAAVSGDEINVYHVTDDASAVTEVATNTQSFDANHFSIYVITGENEKPLTTFNFVANDTTVSTQIVKTGDTLITPTAPDVAGKAFVEWQENGSKFDGFGEQTITKTETRTITAKYEDALYVYFYNPEGTQIMRTEKVADHKGYNYSHVSYDVDSTHKLVGWAANQNGTDDITKNIAVPEGSTSVNVYAIIKKGYWVTFDSDGGSIVDSQFVLNGDKLVLDKSTTPTKPGYTFDGWYDGSTKVENDATVISPMTLKAHWNAAEVNYTINYWQQKVTDDKNATDAQKTYEYVSAETKKATTGTPISAENLKTYKGFKYNANNSSKNVEISGDGTTIINVYYDRVLCTVKFHEYKQWKWQTIKTVTGLYGANLPEGAWDSSKNLWFTKKSDGSNAVLLTSFDFETAGYAKNQGNVSENGIVTTCNFYAGSGLNGTVKYYNEQSDGTFKLVQTVRTNGESLNVHEKYEGYELYRYSTDSKAQETAQYWEKQSSVKDSVKVYGEIINIASKLKTYNLSYYNYNSVTKKEENIKYTASLKSYANYTPAKPSELPSYYVFGGWYKDKACTTKFDFNTEKMPNANVQIYAKWTAKKINLTYNLNTPDGTSKKVNSDVDAGTIASTVLPSASEIKGYSFAGWYYADGNGNITKNAFNANEAITKDTSVIGKWLYNGKLTVVYKPGTEGTNATVPTDSNIYAGGAKVTVAKNATTTSKKKFLGWKLKGNLYHPGDAFEVNKNLANDTNVITLTAEWGNEEHSTTMSYNPGNGRGDVKTVPVKNNESVTLKSEKDFGYQAREVEGKEYYFAGWATSMEDANNGKATYAAGQTVHVDVNGENVLYATWIEKTVITVKAKSDTTTYTGKEHKVEGFKETEFTVDGNKYTVEGLKASGAAGTDAGKYTSKVTGTAVVKDAAGNDVTAQFTVKTENGNLVINRKKYTVETLDGNKTYDGTPLTAGAKINGIIAGEVVEIKTTKSLTDVGNILNDKYELTWKTAKATNYKLDGEKFGTLTVTTQSIDPGTDPENPNPDYTGAKVNSPKDEVYDGKEHKWIPTVTDKADKKLEAGKDYTVEYSTKNFKDVGTIDVTITGIGNYTGTVTRTYKITPKSVTVKAEDKTKVFGETDPKLTAKVDGTLGNDTVDYKLSRKDGEAAGKYEITVKGDKLQGNYTVTYVAGTLTITAQSIDPGTDPENPNPDYTGAKVNSPKDEVYDGKEHKWIPTVTDKADKKLEAGKDYTVEYSTKNFKDVGTIDVTITGIGNYTGTVTRTYKITPKSVTVKAEDKTKVFGETDPKLTAKVDGTLGNDTVDYKLSRKDGEAAGKYEITVKGDKLQGNYTVTYVAGTLTITAQSIDPGTDPENPNPDYTGAKVNSPKDEVYDGKEHKWIPTVTDKADKKLEAGKDYTVEYSTKNFKDVGTIDVTITGIGNYSGTVKRSYKVTPKEYTVTTDSATKIYSGTALTAGGKVEGIVSGETVEFTTTGSQTEVGTSKNTYELVWKSAKATNYTLAKESIGKLTVKAKSIVPDDKDTPESDKTGITVSEPSDSKYDGKEHKEVLTVTDTKTGKELVAGTDYSVTYSSDLVNAGTVKVTVAGLGNYTGAFTKTYKITKRSVTLTSATVSKVYDGSALTNTSITVSGDGFVEGEGASYEVTGSQTEVGNSANAFEYKLNEKTLASNYNITKVVGTLTITAAPAPVTPATPSTPSTPSTTPRTPSAPQVTTPVETVEKETTPKAEPKKEEKVEEEYTPKASPQYYWALINLICAILTVLFGLLLLISKRHKSEDDDEEDDDETKQQTTDDDEDKEQEKKRGLFTRVLAVLIAILSVVFFLVTEDLSLPWTWTDQWTIWMVVIGLVQIVVFFVGRKWKNVDNDDDDEEAQQA